MHCFNPAYIPHAQAILTGAAYMADTDRAALYDAAMILKLTEL